MPGGWVTQARVLKGDSRGGEWTDGLLGWAKSIPREQRDSLLLYSSNAYHNINAHLRSDLPLSDSSNVSDYITDIDAAMNTAPPLIQEGTVFRGMDLRGFTPEVGATFTDKGFVSTSLDIAAGERFAEIAAERGREGITDIAIAEIRVPSGTRAVPMFKVWEAHSKTSDMATREREILLPRGSRFRVTKVGRDSKGRRRLLLELLPPAGTQKRAA